MEKREPLWRSIFDDPKHGPLPALLLALTILTGVIDAVSILSLGRVFVANMTGNVVFVGFALAGAPGFSLTASLFALAGFVVGGVVGGALIGRYRENRAVLLRNAVLVQLLLFTVALVIMATASSLTGLVAASAAALAAAAMGMQNSAVRAASVPDLTTTVLTMTITGLAADFRHHNRPALVRRLLAVVTMLLGAAGGALLVLKVSPVAGMAACVGLALVVAAALARLVALGRKTPRPADWQVAHHG